MNQADSRERGRAIEQITQTFNRRFANWDIKLPSNAFSQSSGQILYAGWNIRFRVSGPTNRPLLDYYACHRLTSDEHARIFATGRVKQLPAYCDLVAVPADLSPERTAEIERELEEQNRRIHQLLRRKGLE